VQTAAIEIAEDGLPDFRSQTPETGLIPLFMYELQLLKKILKKKSPEKSELFFYC